MHAETQKPRNRAAFSNAFFPLSGELAALRAKKAHANNNLAGAMWEQSISQEMSAVVARYDVRIRAIRGEIERLQGERARLAAQGNHRP